MGAYDLIKKCADNNSHLSEHKLVHCFAQICLALHHMHHSENAMHHDLKPENILLVNDHNIAKLADFGYSKNFDRNKPAQSIDCFCTPYYVAPEIINFNRRKNNEPFNYKIDCWGLGVILFEMITLKKPFDTSDLLNSIVNRDDSKTAKMVFREIIRIPEKACNSHLKAIIYDIICNLLKMNPHERWDTTQILQQALFRSHFESLLNSYGEATGDNKADQANLAILKAQYRNIYGKPYCTQNTVAANPGPRM